MRRDLRTGRDEPLMPEGTRLQAPDDVSPDRRQLAYEERTESAPFNLWTMPLMGTATPSQIRSSPYNETRFCFAPDGDHYIFVWDESGRAEVYPCEIIYVSPDLRMMAVPLRTTPTVELGTPVALFAMATKRWVSFDASPDGNRFLVIVPEVVANEQPLTAMLGVVLG
jgi:Tol biopolymer transport system component